MNTVFSIMISSESEPSELQGQFADGYQHLDNFKARFSLVLKRVQHEIRAGAYRTEQPRNAGPPQRAAYQ